MYDDLGKIDALFPATGWRAMFSNYDFTNYILTPLIAWAVKQHEKVTELAGLVSLGDFMGELIVAQSHHRFMGFLGPGEDVPDAIEMAERLKLSKVIVADTEELPFQPRISGDIGERTT